MSSSERLQDRPRILDYRTDPIDGTVAFPITTGARGVDVITTLLYLDPDRARVLEHTNRILRHAVDVLGLMDNRNLPIPATKKQLTGQVSLVEHVHFGSDTTLDDVELAMLYASGESNVQSEKVRLTSALIDTGSLVGFVIETVQRNEFISTTDSQLRDELLTLTERYYDL